jgi:signal transduction histidine kinase
MRNVLTERQIVDFLLKERPIAFAITDRELQIVEYGGETQLFADPKHDYQGDSLYDLSPELIGAEAELAALLRGESASFKLPLVNRVTRQGQVNYVDLYSLPYTDPAGAISGILHIIENTTPSGVLEQELVQQRNEMTLLNEQIATSNMKLAAINAELRQLDEVKSRFISVAAHELRNPLASIMGYLELLYEDSSASFTPDQQVCIDVIQRSSQRLLSITNNLLDLTRIEAGRIELDLQRINLLTLVENVATELQPRISAKKQILLLDALPELPMALADEMRSSQVLSNLLSNAIKYTGEKGKITVRIAMTEDKQMLVVSVADTGIGIAHQDQNKIFHSFFRASNVHLSGETGTGLGLSIAKSLVQLQGGRIWFESELNKGSTFYVTFPVDDSEDKEG